MNIKEKFLRIPVTYPKTVVIGMVLLTVLFGLFIPKIQIDTDPENMLSEDEPVRLIHHAIKEEFKLYDIIALGIVDETSENGVFTPNRLSQIAEVTEEITMT